MVFTSHRMNPAASEPISRSEWPQTVFVQNQIVEHRASFSNAEIAGRVQLHVMRNVAKDCIAAEGLIQARK